MLDKPDTVTLGSDCARLAVPASAGEPGVLQRAGYLAVELRGWDGLEPRFAASSELQCRKCDVTSATGRDSRSTASSSPDSQGDHTGGNQPGGHHPS